MKKVLRLLLITIVLGTLLMGVLAQSVLADLGGGGFIGHETIGGAGGVKTIGGTMPIVIGGDSVSSLPVIVNAAASSISINSATLNGNVTSIGVGNPTITVYWGTVDGVNTAGNWQHNATATYAGGVAPYTYNVTGLVSNTKYYFNAYATNSGGSAWAGTSLNFTTSNGSFPTVTISSATSITSSTATLNGNVTSTGGVNPSVTMYLGLNDGLNIAGNWTNSASPSSPSQPQGVAPFFFNVTGLNSASLYYFNASATNSGGTSWAGTSLSFLTVPNAPTAITATPTSGQVVLNWTNAVGGTGTSIYTRVQWSTSAYPTSYTDGTTGIAWTSGTTGTIIGLTNGTTYYFSAFTKVTAGSLTQYSVLSAQVYAIPPTTSDIGSIGNLVLLPTDTTISLTWQRATNSASTVIRYSTTSYPATPTNGISVSSSTITGSSILLTGLTAGTNYYFSAWGFNSGNYGSATESMMTTTAGGGTTDVLPNPTINMTPSPPSSGNWFTTLQPFTGFVADFENSWGMPKDSVPFIIGILILLLGGFGLYLKTKSPFIAIVADLVLDIGLIALGLLPTYTVGVVIAFGLGIWALDNIWI